MGKDKLTLTLDLDVLDMLEKAMKKHNERNKSKFVNFFFRQYLGNPKHTLFLLKKKRENMLYYFKDINQQILDLEDLVEKIEKTEKAKEEVNKVFEKSEKDEFFA